MSETQIKFRTKQSCSGERTMFKASVFSSSDTNFSALGNDKPQNIERAQKDNF